MAVPETTLPDTGLTSGTQALVTPPEAKHPGRPHSEQGFQKKTTNAQDII